MTRDQRKRSGSSRHCTCIGAGVFAKPGDRRRRQRCTVSASEDRAIPHQEKIAAEHKRIDRDYKGRQIAMSRLNSRPKQTTMKILHPHCCSPHCFCAAISRIGSDDGPAAQAIAKEGYLGFPMVYKTMWNLARFQTRLQGPFNQKSCVPPSPGRQGGGHAQAIAYCMFWMDLRAEPLVLSVPKMEDGRFSFNVYTQLRVCRQSDDGQ